MDKLMDASSMFCAFVSSPRRRQTRGIKSAQVVRGLALLLWFVAGCVNRTEIARNGDAAVSLDGASGDAMGVDAGGLDAPTDVGNVPDAPDPSGQWARSFGGETTDLPTDVAIDAAGNVYIAGILSGPANVGSATVPAGPRNAFVASYTSGGTFRWVESLGSRSNTIGYRVHLAVEGDHVFVATDFNDTATRPEGTLTSAGEQDMLLASFGTDGSFRWWRREGGANEDHLNGLTVDGSGNVYVAGYFHEATEIGGDALAGVRGTGFVASFDSSGTLRWTRIPGEGTSAPIEGLTFGDGELVLIGGFGGFGAAGSDFDLGGTPISGEFGDTFIFGLSPDNDVRWAGQATTGGGMEIWGMVRSAGVTYVAAGLRGFARLGDIELRPSGTYDAVVMAIDATGAGLWANVYGSDNISPIDRATGISLDAMGRVVVTGQFPGSIDLGGGLLDPTPFMSGYNTFVLLLDASGNHLWSTAFDNAAQDGQVSTVVAADEGHVFVATPFRRDATLGGRLLNSAGSEDGALVRVNPVP